MPSEQDIQRQQELLAAHRQRLFHYLLEQAEYGEAATPPAVAMGIADVRAHIQRVKTILRGWDVNVEDHPDDEALEHWS